MSSHNYEFSLPLILKLMNPARGIRWSNAVLFVGIVNRNRGRYPRFQMCHFGTDKKKRGCSGARRVTLARGRANVVILGRVEDAVLLWHGRVWPLLEVTSTS